MKIQTSQLSAPFLRTSLVAACLALTPLAFFGQDLEPADTASKMPTKVQRTAEELAIDAARDSGDLVTLERLLDARRATRPAPSHESNGPLRRFPTTTTAHMGQPADLATGGARRSSAPYFGGDTFVRFANFDSGEFHHTMASDSAGNLYVAWQDDMHATDFIQLYRSSDGGDSWTAHGYVRDVNADLMEPSIAVGEGSSGDLILVAYIRDDGTNIPVPEVVTFPLTGNNPLIYTVPVWSFWEGYRKPMIVTDSYDYSSWYAYLTCEGVFDSATNNINICTWRSTDGGTTWGDDLVAFGNSDSFEWTDPDLDFGTIGNDVYLSTYCKEDNTLQVAKSLDLGVTYDPPVTVGTLSLLPSNPVDPEIAVAKDHDNIMLAFTYYSTFTSSDDIFYSYSTDAGATWTQLFVLPSRTGMDEFAVSITANEGGGSWHMAYASGQDLSTCYNIRPQDLSGYFDSDRRTLDDLGMSGSYSTKAKKGIASNWTTDEATVAWADARDNYPGDLDTYSDRTGALGLMCDERMVHSVNPGTIEFTLNAGPANGGDLYGLVLSMNGTTPGTPLPSGLVLPLVWDDTTLYPFYFGPPLFTNFVGYLDANGTTTAYLNIPANSGLPPGIELHFAFATWNPADFVSQAVKIYVALP